MLEQNLFSQLKLESTAPQEFLYVCPYCGPDTKIRLEGGVITCTKCKRILLDIKKIRKAIGQLPGALF